MLTPITPYVPTSLDLEKGVAPPTAIATVSAQINQVMQALNALQPTIDEIAVAVKV